MKKNLLAGLLALCCALPVAAQGSREPVDLVNPYIGNISHLLVPTFPTIQLPNSMLRVYPERADYTSEYVDGLPIIVTNHRERSAFNLLPQQGDRLVTERQYSYDNEHIRPYTFDIDLADNTLHARFAPSHQSAAYEITFQPDQPAAVVLTSKDGGVSVEGNHISGWQTVSGQTRVYVYAEAQQFAQSGIVQEGKLNTALHEASGRNVGAAWTFAPGTAKVLLRYGISFISEEQAKANLYREQTGFSVDDLATAGRKIWNETLGRIQVETTDTTALRVFYSSYYRTFERPICMSEDGRYWSGFDNQVHEDGGTPFYTDDWIWDTYRAAHPLRVLTDGTTEENILASYLRMTDQLGGWMATFPEVNGDSRRMNSNHAVASFADALCKGLHVDAAKAFEGCRRGIEEKTLAPWSGKPAGMIDRFYREHGYIPALRPGEQETDPNVNPNEKRQPVAVTLGTSYDEWCLSRIATWLSVNSKSKKARNQWTATAQKYDQLSYNYRNLFNPETGFFHPKDSEGRFIEPFDYRYSGGQGARNYYGENNGWVYRWDVPHHIDDLISLMGGKEQFAANLDRTFAEPLGKSKFEFYATLPDHTGNVGQFSMANEPSLHIPYLYNYAGKPWKTQKRIRQLLTTWFRNDLMGIPGDEDGGGMTSFVVFSMLGLYPVTPGQPVYTVGSPMFQRATVRLSNGKTLTIIARDASRDNKYIQSATLNGQPLLTPWVNHSDIANGATLVFQMGSKPNYSLYIERQQHR